jgi:hypothetical protein
MEAKYSSEASVDTPRTTRRHIPEDDTLQNLQLLGRRCLITESRTTVRSVRPVKPVSAKPACRVWAPLVRVPTFS